ncbi:MAG TPA: response regulator transcription factor [Solirubrobacteraceae bacterium]|nr:response regulator transcription factor [Solirubrobacteraceae bacterium]
MPTRVIIADDSYLLREGLAQLLALDPGVEVVASCEDHDGTLAAVAAERPDVVLTDIRMPPTNTDEGIRLARTLRETDPEVGVVVLSQYSDPQHALLLLEQGSAGRAYLLKDRIHDRQEVAAAIAAVADGGSMIDPRIVDLLVAARDRDEPSALDVLTTREREILSEIAEGKSNAAIAESLVLTKRAVEKHINSIFLKLDLSQSEDTSKRVKATLLYLAGRRE